MEKAFPYYFFQIKPITLKILRAPTVLLLTTFVICGVFSLSLYALPTRNLCNAKLQIKTATNTIRSVEEHANTLECRTQTDAVCVVFDIDNTLLTNDPNFGGEAWGSWQESLSAKDPNKISNWIAEPDIYRAEAAVRYMLNFHPVEASTLSAVQKLQNHYPTIAMTSRAFSSLATTERQLQANNINLSKNPLGDHKFSPHFLEQNKYKTDLKMYYHGTYYVAGDSKGEALLNLINYYRQQMHKPNLCKVVIVLDDSDNKIDDIVQHVKNKLGYVALIYNALPKASDPKNWDPAVWKTQGQQLYNAIVGLNKVNLTH